MTRFLEILTKILKFLIITVYVFILINHIWLLIAYKMNAIDADPSQYQLSIAIYLPVLGVIEYGAIAATSFVGLILSLVNRYSYDRKKNSIFCLLFVVIPVITYFILIHLPIILILRFSI